MESKKSHTIGFRLKKSLKETIGLIAERETRTVSLQVEHFVRQGIRDYLDENPDFATEQNKKIRSKSSKSEQ